MLGVQPSPEARWKGRGESLQAKLGRKLEVAFLATTNINNNNKKKGRPRLLSASSSPQPWMGGWEHGSTTPPRSVSNGGTWSRPALCTFSSFSFPLSPSTRHLFFFPHFFLFLSSFFFLFFYFLFFVLFFVFLSPLLPLGPPSPRPALPSVGEDQVGDAGLQPISRDHLAHLGCAIVRELEVGA